MSPLAVAAVLVTMHMVGLRWSRISSKSFLTCRKRLANMNSYSVFIVASVITLPKVSDICFLWLPGVIFISRGQFFIPKPLVEKWMLPVLVCGEQEGSCASSSCTSG